MTKNRMTWEEMVYSYPDKWVVLENAEIKGSDIIAGDVIDIKSDDEILSFRAKNRNKNYRFFRTTEGGFYGIIDADFSISIE